MKPALNSEEMKMNNKTLLLSNLHKVRWVKAPRPGGANDVNDQSSKDKVELGHMVEANPLHHLNVTKKVLEIAVFLDATAFKRFSDYFQKVGAANVDLEVKHLVLSYINGVQALYLLPSLGEGLTISIVRLELATERDPYESHNGDREAILASFCRYQAGLNPSRRGGPGGWDTAVLVTGLDLHEAGSNDKGITLGLSPVGGVCRYFLVIYGADQIRNHTKPFFFRKTVFSVLLTTVWWESLGWRVVVGVHNLLQVSSSSFEGLAIYVIFTLCTFIRSQALPLSM